MRMAQIETVSAIEKRKWHNMPGVRYHSYKGVTYVALPDLLEASGGLTAYNGRANQESLRRAEQLQAYFRLISAVTADALDRVAIEEVENSGEVQPRRKVVAQ